MRNASRNTVDTFFATTAQAKIINTDASVGVAPNALYPFAIYALNAESDCTPTTPSITGRIIAKPIDSSASDTRINRISIVVNSGRDAARIAKLDIFLSVLII
jgi:hypothetical protein